MVGWVAAGGAKAQARTHVVCSTLKTVARKHPSLICVVCTTPFVNRTLWDTSVRYNLDEDPRKMEQHISKDAANSKYSACALGAGGKVAALCSGRHMFFHAVGEGTGKQIESVGAAHGSSGALILSVQVRGVMVWDLGPLIGCGCCVSTHVFSFFNPFVAVR